MIIQSRQLEPLHELAWSHVVYPHVTWQAQRAAIARIVAQTVDPAAYDVVRLAGRVLAPFAAMPGIP